jgi:hydroxymethylglutaryl-CoA lyase
MEFEIKALPDMVEIVDVGPRDGLQNLPYFVPTEVKMELIRRMAAAGVKKMEVTSFVHPKAIPQMADASKIAEYTVENAVNWGLTPLAMVPNLNGAQAAYAAGVRNVNYVMSVSEAHNQANINRTVQASLDELVNIIAALPDLKINLSLATVFGCPFAGEVQTDEILYVIKNGMDRGITAVTLCDTIGVANPLQTKCVIEAVQQSFPSLSVALHMHDTHGMALANTLIAISSGITRFETSIGGLGGCPFAPGAAGNLATEDLNNMLLRMGIKTGINPVQYETVVSFVQQNIYSSLMSHMSKARSYQEFNFFQTKNNSVQNDYNIASQKACSR